MGQDTTIIEVPTDSLKVLEWMAAERGLPLRDAFVAAVGALLFVRTAGLREEVEQFHRRLEAEVTRGMDRKGLSPN